MSVPTPHFIHLLGKHSSVVLELSATGAPIWRHWGERLSEGTFAANPFLDQLPVPSFSLDQNVPPSLFPTFGNGWYGAPALLAHRAGRDFAQAFTDFEVDWRKPQRDVALKLTDKVACLEVEIGLALDPDSDVLSVTTLLRNLGQADLDIQHLSSACLPLTSAMKRVRSFAGRHNHEFQLFEDRLSPASWVRENRRGLTSHACPPLGLVAGDATDTDTGPVYGVQLAWSGNHFQRIDATEDGGYLWQLGQWLAPGEVTLAAGAELSCPKVLATYSPDGFNGVAQNFHTAIRKIATWPHKAMSPRPVHFNTWEGVYFDLSEPALKDMATGAAALGVERFVLDDGWFQGRRDDSAGLGDWFVDTAVFPNGLTPLIDHVTGLGMSFGLWVEPEMINPDSDLYRAHPDWALHLDGRPMLTARNQLVLDLSNRDAFDFIYERLSTLLDKYDIDYLKWDHNRDLTTAGHFEKPAYRSQVLNAYRLFDAIRQNFPNVEIEACAGGGGRIDAGILAFTHRVWTSDCIDSVSRLNMQRNFLQFFPPEIMGCHIGASPAHATGRRQSLEFRASVAMTGHLGIELDPRRLTENETDSIRQWVALYKAQRDTLHAGRVWQGSAGDSILWQAHGHIDDFVVFIYRVEPTALRFPPVVHLPFLGEAKTYAVSCVLPNTRFAPTDGPFFTRLEKGEIIMQGSLLKHRGLPLPFMKAESALIVRFTATETH
jgi:alpha-galactosidase